MKLVSFISENKEQLGAVTDKGILLLSGGKAPGTSDAATIADMFGSPDRFSQANAFLSGYGGDPEARLLPESDVVYLPCIPNPGRIFCVGLNYRKHAIETDSPIPDFPVIFSKFSDCVAAHRDVIPLPVHSSQVDYEGELGVLIGKETFQVAPDDALDSVFGYFVANDVSARDFQLRTSQWLIGKTCEKFCPIGPYVVTSNEIANPNSLRIQTMLNGHLVQDSNTSDMIFDCKNIISYISSFLMLKPGDIILTGTPEGVILGKPESERVWLKPGDNVTISIEGLGTLSNSFRR